MIRCKEGHKRHIYGKSFDDTTKCFVMTVTNQNCMNDRIKKRLNLRNSCYHLVLNIFIFPYAV